MDCDAHLVASAYLIEDCRRRLIRWAVGVFNSMKLVSHRRWLSDNSRAYRFHRILPVIGPGVIMMALPAFIGEITKADELEQPDPKTRPTDTIGE